MSYTSLLVTLERQQGEDGWNTTASVMDQYLLPHEKDCTPFTYEKAKQYMVKPFENSIYRNSMTKDTKVQKGISDIRLSTATRMS